jgi:hypothetical protein
METERRRNECGGYSSRRGQFHRQVHIDVYFGGLTDNFANEPTLARTPVASWTIPPTSPLWLVLRWPHGQSRRQVPHWRAFRWPHGQSHRHVHNGGYCCGLMGNPTDMSTSAGTWVSSWTISPTWSTLAGTSAASYLLTIELSPLSVRTPLRGGTVGSLRSCWLPSCGWIWGPFLSLRILL